MLLVLLEKEVLVVPEDQKEHQVCQEYPEALVDLDEQDLQVKQELLANLEEMENRYAFSTILLTRLEFLFHFLYF